MSMESRIRRFIRDVPDFPRPGIVFKDITPLLADPSLFRDTIDALAAPFAGEGIQKIFGIESRGFIFGPPLAYQLRAGFVPARKPGKLPFETVREAYALEYGSDALEVHRDALQRGERVLVVDDLLATGGTAAAAIRLVETLGGEVVGVAFVTELEFLRGREKLPGRRIHTLVRF